MKRLAVVIASLAAASLAAAPPPLEIDHEPLACAAVEGFVRVPASARPTSAFASARVEFRTSDATGWYAVGMTGTADALVGVLPRPASGTQSFHYRVVAEDTGGRATSTPDYEVPVVPSTRCSTPAVALERGAPVVVAVPEGAPVVPPVPPGFNPAGSISQAEAAGNRPSHLGQIAGGAAVLGGVAGLATVFGSHAEESTGFGAGSGPDPNLEPERLEFLGSEPPPGSTISLSHERLTMFFRAESRGFATQQTVSFEVRLWAFVDPWVVNCVRMRTPVSGGRSPLEAAVDGPFELVSSSCGSQFDVRSASVIVWGSTGPILETGSGPLADIPVEYHFVP